MKVALTSETCYKVSSLKINSFCFVFRSVMVVDFHDHFLTFYLSLFCLSTLHGRIQLSFQFSCKCFKDTSETFDFVIVIVSYIHPESM